MVFTSLDMMVNFTAKYNASATAPGFNDSTKASLKAALTDSHTSCETTVDSNCTGFPANAIANFPDLIALVGQYNTAESSPETDTPVAVIVMPWQFLDDVSASSAGLNIDNSDDLFQLINDLTYVTSSGSNFISNGLYTGKAQLAAIHAVKDPASAELSNLLNLLAAANLNGTAVEVVSGDPLVVNGQSFPLAEKLVDEMNNAMSNFSIDFEIDFINPPINPTGSLGTNSYTWALDGNDQWEGTSGTQKMSHVLLNSGGTNYKIILDRQAGTLQCWRAGTDETLDQNQRSNPLLIRGNSNSLNCMDPANTDAVHASMSDCQMSASPI
jgi:hypothetical protein